VASRLDVLSAGRSGSGDHCLFSKYPFPRDAGDFNEPNKTVNKFYLHGTNSVLEGLRHCYRFPICFNNTLCGRHVI